MDMENCLYSGWAQEADCTQCDAAPVLPWLPPPHVSASFQFHGFPSWSLPVEKMATEDRSDERTATASKSHSQAEKRRRDRINAQLATLRKLIPKSEKMDKAALLGSVIDHVKDLKRQAMEVSDVFTVPTEVDEVTVDCEFDQGLVPNNTIKTPENIFIKASVCCEDRPELFSELIRALQGLKLTTIRADMASLSGRTKSILVLCSKDDKNSVCISTLKQSLKVVLSRIVSSSTASNYRITSKRQRFFLPSNFPQ